MFACYARQASPRWQTPSGDYVLGRLPGHVTANAGMLFSLTYHKITDTKPIMPKPYEQKEITDKERYVICASDEFILESGKSDNPSPDEIRIVSLQAFGCPIKRVCADTDQHGRSTYCIHLTAYPFMVT